MACELSKSVAYVDVHSGEIFLEALTNLRLTHAQYSVYQYPRSAEDPWYIEFAT